MLRVALVSLVVFGAPDKDKAEELGPAAKKLRTAWASQYEWREDGIKNVTLGFSWERTYTSPQGADAVTKALICAMISLASCTGLPLDRRYSLVRISPSSSISTALELVDPPSNPTYPRTVVPGSKVAGANGGIV